MIFDTLRRARTLKLAAVFGFAAASATMRVPRENPEITELRHLTRDYESGTMTAAQFIRMSDLTQSLADEPAAQRLLTNAGLICAHSSGSSGTAAGSAAAACPSERRRRAQGDMSHLLVFHHWV